MTLFTGDSRRLWLVLASVGCVGLLLVVISAGLLGLAHWTELRYDVYPWRDEDYLRYLLPSLFANKGHNRLLLVGPSEAREDLLYEKFDETFPEMRTFQGAQSLATLDDVLLSLEYIDKVYGVGAMPRVLVVGITPRFVANIPRGRSPFVTAIDRYSPAYRVTETREGSRLVPKGWGNGIMSRVRFLLKQQARYRAALCTALRSVAAEPHSESPLGRWLRRCTLPYRYHHLRPLRPDMIRSWLRHPESFWFKVHAWEPAEDAPTIRLQITRLLDFARLRGMRLYVVNLPEHVWNREGYRPGRYETYLKLVQDSLGSTPLLDLREMLGPEEFYDSGHATLPGAVRVTERVVQFIRSHADVAGR